MVLTEAANLQVPSVICDEIGISEACNPADDRDERDQIDEQSEDRERSGKARGRRCFPEAYRPPVRSHRNIGKPGHELAPWGFLLPSAQRLPCPPPSQCPPAPASVSLIADKAFEPICGVFQPLAAAGKSAVIPPRQLRSTPSDFDPELYKAHTCSRIIFANSNSSAPSPRTARNFLAAIH